MNTTATRTEYEALSNSELIAMVDYHRQQANVDGFMGRASEAALLAAVRHGEKLGIAEGILHERMEAARKLVEG